MTANQIKKKPSVKTGGFFLECFTIRSQSPQSFTSSAK